MTARRLTSKALTALLALLLAGLTLAVYAPAYRADFVDYDDPLYIADNPWVVQGLNRESFNLAWTQRVAGNWHPITMLSHLLDVTLYGLEPAGHHLTSLLIHAVNVMLLFGLLHSLFGGLFRPALATALFALHPLNVDSVVWIAERKNVLSTLFWLSATCTYVRFMRRPSVFPMLGTILLFALGLMAKPMLVTFPLTLLMLDLWPLAQVGGFARKYWPQWNKLIQVKMALFILAFGCSALTLITQFPRGYEHSPTGQPVWARALFALEHYRMYLQKFFWPSGLSVFYPRLEMPPDIGSVLLSGFLLVAITVAVLAVAGRAPAWAFGWFWFIGTLLPVIGIIAIGQHSVADRYMYVPMIGLLISLLWGISTWPKGLRPLGGMIGVLAIIACGWVTRSMLPHWQSSEALFQRAVTVTTGNYAMLSNLGRQKMIHGQTDEAMALFQEALRLEPRHVKSLNNLGFALASKGQDETAIPYFESALQEDPRDTTARINLARSLVNLNRHREAYQQYEILMRTNPDSADIQAGWQATGKKVGM